MVIATACFVAFGWRMVFIALGWFDNVSSPCRLINLGF